MQIFPAIDIKNGKCVRLYQGDFAKETMMNADPIDQAAKFVAAGATFLHIVDLDGAVSGKPTNIALIQRLQQQVKIPIQVGGGIRTMTQVDTYLRAGAERVIIGSAALSDPDFVKAAVTKYGDKIIIGIDAKNGFVATEGWLQLSDKKATTFAGEIAKLGVHTIIYTDISKDGTLAGPNFEKLRAIQKSARIAVIASGGVSSKADLEQLAAEGFYGAIAGKALYEGKITMADVLEVEGHAY